MKFVLEIDLDKSKHMSSHTDVAKALRDLADKFDYSCENYPHGPIMDTHNDMPVGHYGVVLK